MEQTTSPIESKSNKASLGDRFLGILIDWLVFLVLYYLLELVLGWGLSTFGGLLYILLRDAFPFLEGQSVGKKVMKTRAVKEDSEAPLTNDYATSLIRNLPAAIPLVSLVDAIYILVGDERKRLGDKIGKTIVIKE